LASFEITAQENCHGPQLNSLDGWRSYSDHHSFVLLHALMFFFRIAALLLSDVTGIACRTLKRGSRLLWCRGFLLPKANGTSFGPALELRVEVKLIADSRFQGD
jgi:hypothetical protein